MKVTSKQIPEKQTGLERQLRSKEISGKTSPSPNSAKLEEHVSENGASKNEMTGFIKSLTYSVPDNTVWEHSYPSRVPKHLTVAITYQILHKESPNMLTKFYGKGSKSNIHFLDKNLTGTFQSELII